LKNKNLITSIILFFCCIPLYPLWSQNNGETSDQTKLSTIIKNLQAQSDYTINYDPSLLETYTYSGKFPSKNIIEIINTVLYDTPFEYEINNKTILIYKSDPSLYQLCGTILDANNQEPLIGANIFVQNTIAGSQSNTAGFFEITLTAYKNQKIEISYLGYKTKTISIQKLKLDDCNPFLLEINENFWNEEIVITDYLIDGITEGATYNSYELDYSTLSKYHSSVEHDILKTTQFLPGVMSIDDSASNLYIRGGTPDQNLILWEGTPLYNAGHLFGMISAINPFSVDRVKVYKGSYDPKYDNRVGGIIDISLQDSVYGSNHGSIGSTLTENHINLDIPVLENKLTLSLSGRHSINSIYDSPTLQNYTTKVFQFSLIDDFSEGAEQGLINADQQLNYSDWNTKIIYNPTDHLSLKASLYSNHQNFQYQFSFPDDPFLSTTNISVDTRAFNTQIDWNPNQKWNTSLSFVQSVYRNLSEHDEVELGSMLVDYDQFNDIEDKSISLTTKVLPTPHLSLSGGYTYNIKQVEFELIDDNIHKPYYEDRSRESGSFHNLYASSHYTKNSLSANVGMRTTYDQDQDQWVFSPRFTVQLAISKSLRIKTEGGIYHQFISQLSEYGRNILQVDNPLWIINSTESRESQRASKIAAGLIYTKGGWLLDMEAYYNKTTGLNTLSPLFSAITNTDFSSGESSARGLNVLLKKRWSGFHTWINYAMGEVLFTFPDIRDKPLFAPNDIRHNLSLVSSYNFSDFQFSIHTHYHSGLPFSNPIGVFDYYDVEEEQQFYSIDYVEINDDRLKPYVRVDFNVNYRPTIKALNNIRAEFSLSFINIFNRDNILAREYYLDYRDEQQVPTLAFIEKSLLQNTPLFMFRLYW